MGDVPEVGITPETPGRPAILNPFESPNDYHRLHESVVASPSVFKSSRTSSATPAKFKWSIDEMASLLPVEIDPEDIHRQSLYLSQTRADAEIEEKRQYAIEQFFTKGTIVPSPWAAPAGKQSAQAHLVKSTLSPGIPEEDVPTGKCSAACQTTLSLPVDFNLEKVLGDYYKMDEVSDQVQESLSSSSLRRKLFLDGIGSGSESSTPSSPDRSPQEVEHRSSEVLCPVSVSPLQSGMAALTPTSGQFSSSPIQGRGRAYSLGSVTSPLFPEKSSPGFKSPKLSPIVLQYVETPVSGERKRLSFVTPDGMALGSSNAENNHCTESPYVEGCSPIKSCSPIRATGRGWVHPHHRASLLELSPTFSPASERKDNHRQTNSLPAMEMDTCSALLGSLSGNCETASENTARLCDDEVALPDLIPMEETRDNSAVNMAEPSESQEDYWAKEAVDGTPVRLTSSRTGSMLNVENSNMFVSLLAEGSTMPYDNSMQVDSGYNTYSVGTNSTMDGVSSDSQTKESLDPHGPEETFLYNKTQHIKSKMLNLHHC
ncbi:protein aurora borealis [Megalops cyprinoides]|uniref:protein aurora borealis n=1 Tax=Megalops cyprinoides TaxID=118141 RepID=UPI001864D295|nr:protein aurora borealis [Megalops cyprinoides]